MSDMIRNIAFVGAGNLAWHLAPALDNAGYPVREVYSRNERNARQLASRLYQAEVKRETDFTDSDADVIVIAVSDDAIGQVVTDLIVPDNMIVVHTSGSTPMRVLEAVGTQHIGVFYPLQTFSKGVQVNFEDIPILVEGSSAQVQEALQTMARALSPNVAAISSERRLALHLAAVFASNFTNHMVTIAFDLMEDHDLDPDWLKPLIAETLNKSLDAGPTQAQTGPARRGDLGILRRHTEFLNNNPSLREIYTIISQHILERYQS
jgi:predicted short-subunit dehydrogenase-like oxidoreductase (DUF2520 family)